MIFCTNFLKGALAAEAAPLEIYALNAGFRNEDDSQFRDFIQLRRASAENLSLAEVRLIYFNSSGNQAGEISFPENALLAGEFLTLGFAKSSSYADCVGTDFVYNFGTAGLSSTGGALRLMAGGQIIDELCWGKNECENRYAKFATGADANYSLVRQADGFALEKYYPDIDLQAIEYLPVESNAGTDCANLRITEVLSYYESDTAEQFVEIYNAGDDNVVLENCALLYKKKQYVLDGELTAHGYFVYRNQDLVLVKNPSVYAELSIVDSTGEIVSSIKYLHGQRKLTSYALFDIDSKDEN